jgi:hypothetical protein
VDEGRNSACVDKFKYKYKERGNVDKEKWSEFYEARNTM